MLRSIIERAVQKVMITASLRDGIASFVRDKELSSFENWLRGPRVRIVSLLSTVRALKVVAGAGFEPTTFGL